MSRAAVTKAKARAKGKGAASDVLMVAPIVDESWEAMTASFRAAAKPAKWKYQLVGDSGECCNVRYINGRFVRSHLGQELDLLPHSLMLEMERGRVEGVEVRGSIAACPDTTAGFLQRMLELRTGNHQPRNHPVRVPTAPGQPVRG